MRGLREGGGIMGKDKKAAAGPGWRGKIVKEWNEVMKSHSQPNLLEAQCGEKWGSFKKVFFVENENKNGYEQTQGQQWRRCSFECNDNNQHNNSNDHNTCDCDSNNTLNGGSSDDFNGYNYTDISNSKSSN